MRDEFLAEANEIVEALSRDLLVLDQGKNEQTVDLINEVFRGVHTLKGMAGMFGFHAIGTIAHELENLLDDLRLGRVDMSREVLDVLFAGIESFQKLLATPGDTDDLEVNSITRAVEQVASESRQPKDPFKIYEIADSVLAVLTEYEEHRLRTNILEEVPLYRYRVSYPLASIDVALEELKKRTKTLGEIITYLPSVGDGDSGSIDLEILLASRASFATLKESVAKDGGRLEPVPKARRAADSSVPERSTAGTLPPTAERAPEPEPASTTATGMTAGTTEAGAELAPARNVGHSVRVDIRKLDYLMNVVSELSLARGAVERMLDRARAYPELRMFAGDLHRINRSLERNLTTLQEGILGVRMVPLKQLFERVQRGVRQLAREHGKEVQFVVTGAETELDKLIVEELTDPLMHIVRNCIDHGVELPERRAGLGKAPIATLAINAYQKGNHVVIEVEDDGQGIDVVKLAKAAERSGIADAQALQEMERDELLALIFLPGLSTASSVTDTSGRGVGMDVVKHNVAKLGGVVEVQSEFGTGTKFTVTLPITLAIIRVLVVSVAGRIFTVPLTAVREAFVFNPKAVHRVDGKDVVTLRGQTLVLSQLDEQLELRRVRTSTRQYVVVVSVGVRLLGFVVDDLLGQQDVVIKGLGASLAKVRGFAGAAELGGRDVALVLDVPTLLEEGLSSAMPLLAGGEAK
ncbi:MAG: chemotaxis protein CheA [Myxococcales bacterium]|nr:chemotaxis protein CheA [Myxococcales bacterium]